MPDKRSCVGYDAVLFAICHHAAGIFALLAYDGGMKRAKMLSSMFTSRTVRFDDVVTLLSGLGFEYDGSAEGSRVRFIAGDGDHLELHRPHPGNELKKYQLAEVRAFLERQGFKK